MKFANVRWVCLVLFAMALAATAAASSADGRWKLGGDGVCFFDETDSGPDQCDPEMGRWKLGGDGVCYWDAQDAGADQCVPSQEPVAGPSEQASSARDQQEARPVLDRSEVPVETRSAVDTPQSRGRS